MTEFGKRLNEMTVRATSPDSNVRAVLRGRGQASISLTSADVLDQYSNVEALAGQIAHAIERVMSGAEQGRRKLVDEFSRLRVDDTPHWDAERRRYRADRDELPARGKSPHDIVRVETAGLRTWTVGIRPGALERVTAAELCSEVNHAVKDVHRNYAQRLYELKKQRFGDVGPEPKSS